MKIEEKAKDFARKVYTNGQEWQKDSSSIIALGESCYIKGAEEQREIDIKKCVIICATVALPNLVFLI